MNIETLYEDNTFNDFLNELCIKRRIHERDDFKQDVFLNLVEKKENWNLSSAEKIADKIAQRIKRKQIKENTNSLNEEFDT